MTDPTTDNDDKRKTGERDFFQRMAGITVPMLPEREEENLDAQELHDLEMLFHTATPEERARRKAKPRLRVVK